jgi:hypothetical protein
MGFQDEQLEVWGTGDAWSLAIMRIREVDAVMIGLVTGMVERGTTAENVYRVVVEGYLGTQNPRHAQVAARLESNKARIIADVRRALEFGTPPHLIPKIIVDPMLRGATVLGDEASAGELAPVPDSA